MASEGRYTPIDDWYECPLVLDPQKTWYPSSWSGLGRFGKWPVEPVCCGVARVGLGAGALITVVTGEEQGSAFQRAGSTDEVAVGELIHRVVDDKRLAKVDRIGDGYEDL